MKDINTLVWIYTALLLVGGLVGWLKAGSKVSIIMSVLFAIPLALVGLGQLPLLAAEVAIGLLFVVFAVRYAKTKKVMPAGMMAMVSLATVALLLWLQKAR